MCSAVGKQNRHYRIDDEQILCLMREVLLRLTRGASKSEMCLPVRCNVRFQESSDIINGITLYQLSQSGFMMKIEIRQLHNPYMWEVLRS